MGTGEAAASLAWPATSSAGIGSSNQVTACSANIRALAILAITLLVVLIVAYMLSERLSSPIRKLTEIANEMSRGRLYTNIPETQRRDEIGALAAAIDRMGTSIRLAMERLRAKT